MSLPSDYSRCLGQSCDLRCDCLRYLCESYEGARWLIDPAVKTTVAGQSCQNQIKPTETQK